MSAFVSQSSFVPNRMQSLAGLNGHQQPAIEYRMFHAVRGDVDTAIKSNSGYWKINNLARDDATVFEKYNQHAHFWTLISYALQSTFFISFGRIIDERRDASSLLRFLHTLIYAIDQMAINGRPLDLSDFRDYDN